MFEWPASLYTVIPSVSRDPDAHPMAEFYVYLLASRSRALYVGVTNDISRRLAQHRTGESAHTARYRIDRLVRLEAYPTARDALAREKQIKGWRREKKTALVALDNPTWRDLDASRYAQACAYAEARRDPSTSSG